MSGGELSDYAQDTGVEVERFGAFSFYWELTNYNNRLKVGMRDHSSWNTILRVGKLSDRDFPDEEEV